MHHSVGDNSGPVYVEDRAITEAKITGFREVAFMPANEPGALWIVEQRTGNHIRVGHFDSAGTWHFADH